MFYGRRNGCKGEMREAMPAGLLCHDRRELEHEAMPAGLLRHDRRELEHEALPSRHSKEAKVLRIQKKKGLTHGLIYLL